MPLLASFAKLNLSLFVYRARSDGYHPICSVFQLISLHDDLTIEHIAEKKLVITSSREDVPTGPGNIITKAYLAFEAQLSHGLSVHIQKRIPIGGGLGGGSSNAAVLLTYLNGIVPSPFSPQRLIGIAKKIGADVPFFLHGGTMLVRGIGEKLRPIAPGEYRYFILINPNLTVHTGPVFKAFDQSPAAQKRAGRTPVTLLTEQLGENSLKDPLFSLYPIFGQIEQKVRDLGQSLYLSGSGATVFISFKAREARDRFLSSIQSVFPDYEVMAADAVGGF